MARVQYTHPRFKVTLFLAFTFVLLSGMVFVFGKISQFWTTHQNIQVAFTTAESLKPGAHVRYNGVDIGIVKDMTIIRLDEALLAKFAPFGRKDLDFLPLNDATRLAFQGIPEEELPAKLKDELLGKTMIGLTLEVVNDPGRYRTNDAIHIAASIMEDAALEITTGTGRELKPSEEFWVLGQSGDFFTSLSRSVEEVKSVMARVTDIVGAEERQSMKRALGHSQHILAGMDNFNSTMTARMAQSTKKMENLKTSSTTDMKHLGKSFGQLQPEAKRLLDRLAVFQKDVGDKFDDLNKNVDVAKTELNAQSGAIAAQTKIIQDKTAPELKLMHENLAELSKSLSYPQEHMDYMKYYAGRAIEESLPEIPRIQAAIEKSQKNMQSLKYIREQTDKLIGSRDAGEHNYYSYQELERTWARIARIPRESLNELWAWRPLIPNPPDPGQRPKVADMDRIAKKLDQFISGLEQARDITARVMLPPYTGQPANSKPAFPRKLSGRADTSTAKP